MVPPEVLSLLLKLNQSDEDRYPFETLVAWVNDSDGVVVPLVTLSGAVALTLVTLPSPMVVGVHSPFM